MEESTCEEKGSSMCAPFKLFGETGYLNNILCVCVLSQTLRMAMNWPGLLSMGVFYMIVLGIGIWASRKSKREEKKCTGNRSEVTMVGGRNLNVWVSTFTMTGRITTDCPNKAMITVNQASDKSFRVFVFNPVALKDFFFQFESI